MLPRATQPITIVVAGETTDRYGNVIPDWSPEGVTLYPVRGSVQPAQGDVATQHRFSGTSLYTIIVPYSVAEYVKQVSRFRVRYNGVDYTPSAPALFWAEGPLRHIELNVEDVTG